LYLVGCISFTKYINHSLNKNTMKKIFSQIGDRRYLVGFSSSLKSFYSTIDMNLQDVKWEGDNDFSAYHTGQRMIVHYSARDIVENETCFMKQV